jgi:hypothetical protein
MNVVGFSGKLNDGSPTWRIYSGSGQLGIFIGKHSSNPLIGSPVVVRQYNTFQFYFIAKLD